MSIPTPQRIGDPLHCGKEACGVEPVKAVFAIESFRLLVFRVRDHESARDFRVERP